MPRRAPQESDTDAHRRAIHGLDPLLTVADVAALLHLVPDTIRRYARDGKLADHHYGKSWRFEKRAVQAFLARRDP
jgi:excisionase family DNA binding protein